MTQVWLIDESEQGEDVVAGIRTPEDLNTMKNFFPEAYEELVKNCEILERHYKEMMVDFHDPILTEMFISFALPIIVLMRHILNEPW